jgi:hypothetical protein
MARKEKEEKKVKEEKPEVEIASPVAPVEGPKWIKVTHEELMQYQADKRLIGYNPVTSEALID